MPSIAKTLFEPAPETEENSTSFAEKQQMKILNEVYSKDDIEMKTDLTPAQVMPIAKGYVFAEKFDVPILKALCDQTLILLVSKGRLGRKEFVSIAQATTHAPEAPSLSERLLGVKG